MTISFMDRVRDAKGRTGRAILQNSAGKWDVRWDDDGCVTYDAPEQGLTPAPEAAPALRNAGPSKCAGCAVPLEQGTEWDSYQTGKDWCKECDATKAVHAERRNTPVSSESFWSFGDYAEISKILKELGLPDDLAHKAWSALPDSARRKIQPKLAERGVENANYIPHKGIPCALCLRDATKLGTLKGGGDLALHESRPGEIQDVVEYRALKNAAAENSVDVAQCSKCGHKIVNDWCSPECPKKTRKNAEDPANNSASCQKCDKCGKKLDGTGDDHTHMDERTPGSPNYKKYGPTPFKVVCDECATKENATRADFKKWQAEHEALLEKMRPLTKQLRDLEDKFGLPPLGRGQEPRGPQAYVNVYQQLARLEAEEERMLKTRPVDLDNAKSPVQGLRCEDCGESFKTTADAYTHKRQLGHLVTVNGEELPNAGDGRTEQYKGWTIHARPDVVMDDGRWYVDATQRPGSASRPPFEDVVGSLDEAMRAARQFVDNRERQERGNSSEPKVVEDAPDDFSIVIDGKKVREGLHKDEIAFAMEEVKAGFLANSEAAKEAAEHPSFTPAQIQQIVEDHKKSEKGNTDQGGVDRLVHALLDRGFHMADREMDEAVRLVYPEVHDHEIQHGVQTYKVAKKDSIKENSQKPDVWISARGSQARDRAGAQELARRTGTAVQLHAWSDKEGGYRPWRDGAEGTALEVVNSDPDMPCFCGICDKRLREGQGVDTPDGLLCRACKKELDAECEKGNAAGAGCSCGHAYAEHTVDQLGPAEIGNAGGECELCGGAMGIEHHVKDWQGVDWTVCKQCASDKSNFERKNAATGTCRGCGKSGVEVQAGYCEACSTVGFAVTKPIKGFETPADREGLGNARYGGSK